MSQTDIDQKFFSDENLSGATLSDEIAANQAAQEKSGEIKNLPVESIGSYARIKEVPGETDSSGSGSSPPED